MRLLATPGLALRLCLRISESGRSPRSGAERSEYSQAKTLMETSSRGETQGCRSPWRPPREWGPTERRSPTGLWENKRKELRYSIFRLRYIVATVDLYTTTYRNNLIIEMRKQIELTSLRWKQAEVTCCSSRPSKGPGATSRSPTE